MYGVDDEELREELRRIDTANKENALYHINKPWDIQIVK